MIIAYSIVLTITQRTRFEEKIRMRKCAVLKMLGLLVLMTVILVSSLSATVVGAKIIALDSWLYEGLDTLYQESGKVVPFTSRPYTVEAYRYYLDSVNTSHLSEAGKALHLRIGEALHVRGLKEEKDSGFGYSIILSPELYMNTEKTLIWDNASQHYLNKYNVHNLSPTLPKSQQFDL